MAPESVPNSSYEDIVPRPRSPPQLSTGMPNNKRDATYFASAPSFHTFGHVSDADSESVSSATGTLSSSSSSQACETESGHSSVSQEIAARYRAAQAVTEIVEDGSGSSPIDDNLSATTSFNGPSVLDAPSIRPLKELKPKYRQSRADGLRDARREAVLVMNASGLGETDKLPCLRYGCRDTLDDLKALTYHIHIHNIHDRAFVCSQCGGRYDDKRELAMHVCRYPPPNCPIKETLRRVFVKLSCVGGQNPDETIGDRLDRSCALV